MDAVERQKMITRIQAGLACLSPIAVHEAGHAVAACAYRIRFDCVKVHARPRRCKRGKVGGELAGLVHPWNSGTALAPKSMHRRENEFLVVLLSGRAAMEVLHQKSAGYEQDYAHALKRIRWRFAEGGRVDGDLIFATLRRRAAELMIKKVVGLVHVARLLQERGELTADEVRIAVYGK